MRGRIFEAEHTAAPDHMPERARNRLHPGGIHTGPRDRWKAQLAAFRMMTVTAPLLLLVADEDGITRHVVLDPWNPSFDPLIAMGVGAGPNVVSF